MTLREAKLEILGIIHEAAADPVLHLEAAREDVHALFDRLERENDAEKEEV